MTSPDELRPLLARLGHGLDAHAELLVPYAFIETALVRDPDPLTAACTRIGGDPDLPPDLEWPAHTWPLSEVVTWPDWARAEVEVARAANQVFDKADRLVMPLPFIMQINLAAFEPHDPRLPTHGLLSFFAATTTDTPEPDLGKCVASRVLYSPTLSSLYPRPHPPTTDEPPTTAHRLRPERAIAWDIPYEDMMGHLATALPPDAYAALVAAKRSNNHALWPAPCEGIVDGIVPPPGHVALLRIEDDMDAGFPVGDASWLTFVITEQDLQSHRFDRARATVYVG